MTDFRRARSPKHEWSDPQLRSASTNRPLRSIQSKERPRTVHRHQSAPLPPIIYLNTADRATRSAPDRKENRLKNRRPQGKLPHSPSQRRYIQSTPLPWIEFYPAERCESGRIGQSRKLLSWQRDRGFDPHPLRQTKLACVAGLSTRPADKTLTYVRWINPSYAFQLRLFLQRPPKLDHR